MTFPATNLRSVFNRLAPRLAPKTCIVAPLAIGTALLADVDGAFARGGGGGSHRNGGGNSCSGSSKQSHIGGTTINQF